MRSSLDSQGGSDKKNSVTPQPPPVLLTDGPSEEAEYNRRLIKLCCLSRPDCLHRKIANGLNQPRTQFANLTDHDLSSEFGRDIWNETALHLVARFAPETSSIHELLTHLLSRSHPSLVNIRNINGETFMHILAHRFRQTKATISPIWNYPKFQTLVTVASSCGYQFHSCNSSGLNFLASILPDKDSKTPSETPLEILQCIVQLLGAAVDDSHLQVTVMDQFLIPSLQTLTMPFQDMVLDSVVDFLSLHIGRLEGLESKSQSFSRWKAFTESTLFKYKTVRARFDVLQTPGLFGFIETLLHDDVHLLKSPQWLSSLPDRIARWLALGADPNSYDTAGRTVLMAVLDNMENSDIPGDISKTLADMLLADGADLRLRDRDGNTALHYAVRTQIPQVVKILIGSGVDIQARNYHGESAMGLAVNQYEQARPGRWSTTKTTYGTSQNTLVKFFDARGTQTSLVPAI
ncbi:hypothetical protein GQ53DRAFT_817163 [Thozetella sp. PMI_491]|nr:hypothetical protein GQ53DRAFT_817163 [Thozetella sp. PMI_491]